MNISGSLNKLFQQYRIIFWYDEKQEFEEQFKELEMNNIEKIHVQNNAFEIKYIVTKQKPEAQFLLYFNTAKPANEENWLLDLEIAYCVFHTNQEALFLQELGLSMDFKELVGSHIDFFKSKDRLLRLKELLGSGDSHSDIRFKMLAVVFNTDNVSIVNFIHAHAYAFALGSDKYDADLDRYKLFDFYWKEISRRYNYFSEKPGIYDLLIEVFSHNFVLGKNKGINRESKLLISIWKNTHPYRDQFSSVSSMIAKDLHIEEKLNNATIDEIVQDELFRLTDLKIIHELVNQMTKSAISKEKVLQIIKLRENKFWFGEFESLYNALAYAAEMMALVEQYSQLSFDSFNQGAEDYAKKFYLIDLFYRKFIFSFRSSNHNSILGSLSEKVEKVYANDWLLQSNDNWQKVIDGIDNWPHADPKSQQSFFQYHVSPFINKGQRLFVIISDALRFECGAELSKILSGENRFEASLDYMFAQLPSYTQMGMAALLPHKELLFQNESDSVLVDGLSTHGTPARAHVLAKMAGVTATAIKAEDFMKMNSATEGRDFVKHYDLIYIYNNQIDKVGDDKESEARVFDAVEKELQYIRDVLKKIANMNGNNMIITSDHGFLYQHQPLDESDFTDSNYSGELWKESRRFILGKNLRSDNKMKHFSAENIRMNADLLIPKSINRLRIKGAGSRFIHGGASLQEIVIPLVKVTKKRQDTTSRVEVDIIKSTDKITTNILAVSFIQNGLVTEKVLPRTVRAALYADDGEILSDVFTFNFDIEEGSTRQREIKYRFQIGAKASSIYKNQRVKLVLEEPVENSARWKHYKDYFYSLNISFTSDFDDF